jgi:hypothetical protein
MEAGTVLSLIVVFHLGGRRSLITVRRYVSHASPVWQIRGLSQFLSIPS